MQGPTKIVAAALYEHPHGVEVRVYVEPEERDDLLHSEVHRSRVGALEQKAAYLRQLLREQGWTDLAIE